MTFRTLLLAAALSMVWVQPAVAGPDRGRQPIKRFLQKKPTPPGFATGIFAGFVLGAVYFAPEMFHGGQPAVSPQQAHSAWTVQIPKADTRMPQLVAEPLVAQDQACRSPRSRVRPTRGRTQRCETAPAGGSLTSSPGFGLPTL